MEIISSRIIRDIMETDDTPAVSVYLPMYRTGDTGQNPIRFKNALRDAERLLVDGGRRAAAAGDMLAPARRLLDDGSFWQHQADGLAAFIGPQTFRYYRVPYSFREMLLVEDRFHIKPLLPLFDENGLFYVLALSQNQNRLLQCTRYSVREITPPEVPVSLAVALQYEEQEEAQHQFHTVGPGPAIFHGQGASKDFDKDAILRYFQAVDRSLHGLLKDQRLPLILAAVEYLHPLYRRANTYDHLLDEGLEGNFDKATEGELQLQAWPVAWRYLEKCRDDAAREYREGLGKGQATGDIKEALLAAHDGRMSALFVAAEAQRWGRFEPSTRKIYLYDRRKPGSQDLLDLIAVYTLSNSGAVYASDAAAVPGGNVLAGVLRY